MDIINFIQELLIEIQELDFIEDIELHEEIFLVKGRIYLRDKSFLKVYYNSKTTVQSFAWIKDEKRLWAVDYDKYKDWHIHKFPDAKEHHSCSAMSLSEIVQEFKTIWKSYDL